MNWMPIVLGAAVVLSACTEKPQTASARKSDETPWASKPTPYAVAGYKGGEQAAWEQQIKSRAQGQNEYNRTAAP